MIGLVFLALALVGAWRVVVVVRRTVLRAMRAVRRFTSAVGSAYRSSATDPFDARRTSAWRTTRGKEVRT